MCDLRSPERDSRHTLVKLLVPPETLSLILRKFHWLSLPMVMKICHCTSLSSTDKDANLPQSIYLLNKCLTSELITWSQLALWTSDNLTWLKSLHSLTTSDLDGASLLPLPLTTLPLTAIPQSLIPCITLGLTTSTKLLWCKLVPLLNHTTLTKCSLHSVLVVCQWVSLE